MCIFRQWDDFNGRLVHAKKLEYKFDFTNGFLFFFFFFFFFFFLIFFSFFFFFFEKKKSWISGSSKPNRGIIEVRRLKGGGIWITERQTDRPTDEPTDRPTE